MALAAAVLIAAMATAGGQTPTTETRQAATATVRPHTAVPEPTPEPTTEAVAATATPEARPTPEPWIDYGPTFTATRYGESYNGSGFGCWVNGAPVGYYSSDDPSILAAPPARYAEWPCGTELEVCYGDRCLSVVRVDSCPGCGPNHVDLSEAGLWYLCRDACGVLHGITIRLRIPTPPASPVGLSPVKAADAAYTDKCGDQPVPRSERKCSVG